MAQVLKNSNGSSITLTGTQASYRSQAIWTSTGTFIDKSTKFKHKDIEWDLDEIIPIANAVFEMFLEMDNDDPLKKEILARIALTKIKGKSDESSGKS